MKKVKIEFEIHDITAREMLCENVSFDDIPELVSAYEYLRPNHQIEACYREITTIEKVRLLPEEEFAKDWFEMLDTLIDNFEH